METRNPVDSFKIVVNAVLKSSQDRLPGFQELNFLTDLTQLETWAKTLDVSQLGSSLRPDDRETVGAAWVSEWMLFEVFWGERNGETTFLLACTNWMQELAKASDATFVERDRIVVNREVSSVRRNLNRPESAMRDNSCCWVVNYKSNAYEAASYLARYLANKIPEFWVKLTLWMAEYDGSHNTFDIFLYRRKREKEHQEREQREKKFRAHEHGI